MMEIFRAKNKNIYKVDYSELNGRITKAILDDLTKPENDRGKRENNYWVLKADLQISPGNPEVANDCYALNLLFQAANQKGCDNVMIVDR